MATDNVEAVRQVYDEWARGNFTAGREILTEDVAWSWGVPEGRVGGSGPEELVQELREWLAQWAEYRVEARELIELDENTVLVVGHHQGVGKHSGVSVDAPIWIVWQFSDGQVVGLHWDNDKTGVLEAAGVPEEQGL